MDHRALTPMTCRKLFLSTLQTAWIIERQVHLEA